jgi:hypothetical protein
MKKIFGKRPKPQPETIPEPQPTAPIVPISSTTYGVPLPMPETASFEAAEQLQQLAMMLAQQHAAYDYQASAAEAVIEQAQRLYGRQVQHQSKMQELRAQRFPVDLLAASLFTPPSPPQPTAESKQRDTSLKKSARKILES